MTQSLSIVIVERSGQLKSLHIKNYTEEELYKRCGFKKADGFASQCVWNIKINGTKYNVALYAKIDGKANTENKYDFPPPVDTKLFFGSCSLVCSVKDTKNNYILTDLTVEMWEKMYEKLFGGFEDLSQTAMEDEYEEDELANVPKSKKTKVGGYLKDGFVVDDDEEGQSTDIDSNDESDEFETSNDTLDNDGKDDGEFADLVGNIGSELSEEAYDTDSSDTAKEESLSTSSSD
jgi:hypothetical protein